MKVYIKFITEKQTAPRGFEPVWKRSLFIKVQETNSLTTELEKNLFSVVLKVLHWSFKPQ